MIHGDLKGVRDCSRSRFTTMLTSRQMNILVDVVDDVPHARIADFGIAVVTKNLNSTRVATRQDIHSPTWSAPEILNGENPSKESDVYSFAMVMVEVWYGLWCGVASAYCYCVNTGTLRPGSVQRSENKLGSCASRVGGQASSAASASALHGWFVDLDPTLLGSGPFLASGNSRSLADPFFSFHEINVFEVQVVSSRHAPSHMYISAFRLTRTERRTYDRPLSLPALSRALVEINHNDTGDIDQMNSE